MSEDPHIRKMLQESDKKRAEEGEDYFKNLMDRALIVEQLLPGDKASPIFVADPADKKSIADKLSEKFKPQLVEYTKEEVEAMRSPVYEPMKPEKPIESADKTILDEMSEIQHKFNHAYLGMEVNIALHQRGIVVIDNSGDLLSEEAMAMKLIKARRMGGQQMALAQTLMNDAVAENKPEKTFEIKAMPELTEPWVDPEKPVIGSRKAVVKKQRKAKKKQRNQARKSRKSNRR